MNDFSLRQEAQVYGKYFLHKLPNEQTIEIYAQTNPHKTSSASSNDQKIIHFALHHPWSIGFLDAAQALVKSDSELRKRLYFMFAILESRPEYCSLFLPTKRNWLYLFFIFYSGARSVFKAFFGILLLKIITRHGNS
jgi:hypothetical protein